jgi:CDGSH-type Zn-finger protein
VDPEIRIVVGGPMLVAGLPLHRLNGSRDGWSLGPDLSNGEPFALCRCGSSSTMPFCDRAEPYGCFEEEDALGQHPGPFVWDVPDPEGPRCVALKPNGPARVTSGIPITHGDVIVDSTERLSLCRCGASRCQPICDSSHKIVGYQG